jgi:mannose-6-phosphate isomerase-like protein (cupin superfamily)
MKIIQKSKAKNIEDVCGVIRELYQSESLGISIATISGKSIPHKHKKMEEIYYVTKGNGSITIGQETTKIKAGDLIPIPKNKYHFIETKPKVAIELLVATNQKFDPTDVIK